MKTLVSAALILCLSACADQTPFVQPLLPAALAALRQPAIYIAVPQTQLEAQYPGPIPGVRDRQSR